MDHFTPVTALIGGLMIGIATVLYLVMTGRYAGISGIARSVAFGNPDRSMDMLFVVGLLAGGGAWFWIAQHGRDAAAGNPLPLVAVGGLLVGFGTTMGRGCTSGHGVCGLGLLSTRSFVAVVTFVLAGMVTVFVVRHLAHGAL